MTDIIHELTRLINEDMAQFGAENITITEDDTKLLLIAAADATLVAASQGKPVKSQMTSKEIGYVVAALMFDQKGFNRGAVLHPRKR